MTVAPGSAAPEGSLTVPWIVPVPATWAMAAAAIISDATRRLRILIELLLEESLTEMVELV